MGATEGAAAAGAPRPGRLLLVPAPLVQNEAPLPWLLEADRRQLQSLTHWYVETPKVARAWLRALEPRLPIAELAIHPLPARDERPDWRRLMQPMREGLDAGLMSDAGCPGVADPGAGLVAAAQQAGIEVVPLVGPSSILLALMASGLEGQRFSFHGYLPVHRDERDDALRRLAVQSRQQDATQILIETPYRNATMIEALLAELPGDARLCVATGIGMQRQSIRTRSVDEWRRRPPDPGKVPTVFCFQVPRHAMMSGARADFSDAFSEEKREEKRSLPRSQSDRPPSDRPRSRGPGRR